MIIVRIRHRWTDKSGYRGRCIHCRTERETIAIVGIRIHRRLRSYLRPDGVRFTGLAPLCEVIV